jgi:hypothetical protein
MIGLSRHGPRGIYVKYLRLDCLSVEKCLQLGIDWVTTNKNRIRSGSFG